MRTIVQYLLIFFPLFSYGQERVRIPLNSDWLFKKDSTTNWRNVNQQNWEKIDIPHTWNALDVNDDEPGYYRGISWYKKTLLLNKEWKGKEVFLHFEGANQETEVYINGKKAGQHLGGYTAFTIAASKFLDFTYPGADNYIAVKVNNRRHEDIPPLTADFTFFGGIYRNVSLIITNPIHFYGEDDGTGGVFISPQKVDSARAELNIKGSILNNSLDNKMVTIATRLLDAQGNEKAFVKSDLNIIKGEITNFSQDLSTVNPKLWSPESPYLYRAITRIIDEDQNILDAVTHSLGFRYFSFDANLGFFLNGKPYKLLGASRHQDYDGLGNAVPDSLQLKDIVLLKEMGANFLRVAHYPQSPVVLKACDSLGLLASVEIPIVNEISESKAFAGNSKRMQVEMIRQNFNHPSVIIWAYMNEVLLKPRFKDNKIRQKEYFENVRKLAVELEELTKAEDPTRYTMIANHGDFKLYQETGLTKIPMLVGWNLYQGWYGGKIEDFGPRLDFIHKELPGKPLLVTEYGADADERISSDDLIRFDKSIEYAVKYHQGYMNDILSRQFVAGAAVWNLADFSSETREETMPHINNKGLLTINRRPKNSYFLYQSYLKTTPYIKIGNGINYRNAGIAAPDKDNSLQNLQVFSNADTVELFMNAKSLGKKQSENKVSNWKVPFINGKNYLLATANVNGEVIKDSVEIDYSLKPLDLNNAVLPFKKINISCGDNRFYTDDKNEVWFPDQIYTKGSWGHVGGKALMVEKSARQKYGSDRNIIGSINDPLYQTQIVGLKEYRFDVPDGKYEIVLHFAELAGAAASSLVYNLDSSKEQVINQQRIFNVSVNSKKMVHHLDLASRYGLLKAVQIKKMVKAKNGKGIILTFDKVEGDTVLNAISLTKKK